MAKRLFISALALALLLLVPTTAFAQSIQENAPAEIHICYEYGGTPIPNAEVTVYRVGNISSGGSVSLLSPYSGYPVDASLLYSDPQQAAQLLHNYALLNRVSPDAVLITDEDGRVSGDFRVGLYLVVPQSRSDSNGVFRSVPSLVSLPYRASSEEPWAYVVTYYPKSSFTPHNRVGTMNLYVTKKWEKVTPSQRPKEVTVYLLRDGTIADEVTLNEGNRWLYHWQELSEYYDWRVVEKPVSGYSVTMSGNLGSVLLTNTADEPLPEETTEPTDSTESTEATKPSSPSGGGKPKLPQTGMLWWPVPILLCLGFALILLGISIRRGAGYEE